MQLKLASALFVLALAASSFGQSPFTIVRPADGAKVREIVRFQVPRNSVPAAGYIGVYVSNRFVEAITPTERGAYFEYPLDTKKLQLPDGPTKVELVLFVDYNDQPRIVDRSFVTLNISNKANIPVPSSGLQLRYRFHDGTSTFYDVENRVGYQSISADQAAKGGKSSQLPLDSQLYQVEYSVINSFSNGDGLLFTRALPPAGKKQIFLATTLNPEGSWYDEKEFGQAYLRLTSTGTELFGSIPQFFPTEGIGPGPDAVRTLWSIDPLPTLPVRRIRPGDTWQARFLVPSINVATIHEETSLMTAVPARGELMGVEWEMGHPCAKIRHTMTTTQAIQKGSYAGQQLSMEEVFWFALDKGQVQKLIRTYSVSLGGGPVAPAAPAQTGTPAGGGGGRFGGGGGGKGRTGGGGGGGAGDDVGAQTPTGSVRTQPPGAGGPPNGRPFPGQVNNPASPNTPAAPVTNAPGVAFRKLVMQQTFILRG